MDTDKFAAVKTESVTPGTEGVAFSSPGKLAGAK